MNAALEFLAQRRKAIAYLFAALGELVVQAVPQSTPQNALLLHAVIAVLGLVMVHGVPNEPAPTPAQILTDLVVGDAAGAKHAADAPPPPIPVTVGDTHGA